MKILRTESILPHAISVITIQENEIYTIMAEEPVDAHSKKDNVLYLGKNRNVYAFSNENDSPVIIEIWSK